MKMNPNVFGICITVIGIAAINAIGNYQVEHEKGENVRNLLKLQQAVDPYRSYDVPPSAKLKPSSDERL